MNILVLVDKQFSQKDIFKKGLLERIVDKKLEVKEYDNKVETLKWIKENFKSKKQIIIIDNDAIFPFMYLTKVRGIIAAAIFDERSAHMTTFHNNSNVMCLAYENTAVPLMVEIVYRYLEQDFEAGRHMSRIDMLDRELVKG